ncbi:ComEC/Rec2 family competence protein [Nitrobacter sp. TKz-YC01]
MPRAEIQIEHLLIEKLSEAFYWLELADQLRWTRLVRQFGGLAKVDRVRFYAANCSVISAIAWTSSGVLPAKVECGRRRL